MTNDLEVLMRDRDYRLRAGVEVVLRSGRLARSSAAWAGAFQPVRRAKR